MKKNLKSILALFLTVALLAGLMGIIPVSAEEAVTAAAPAPSGEIADASICLKDDWRVFADSYDVGETEEWYKGFPGSGSSVSIPSNASGANAGGGAIFWYAKTFTPSLGITGEQRLLLSFEGCQYYTKVYMNGNYIGDHEGAYGKFSFDVTDFVRDGQENMLVLRLFSVNGSSSTIRGEYTYDNLPMWLTGVPFIQTAPYLSVVPEICIADVFADTKYDSGKINVEVIVDNPTLENKQLSIWAQVGPNEQNITLDKQSGTFTAVPGLSKHTVVLTIEDFEKWSPEKPFLYKVNVRTQAEGAKFCDATTIQVGFRDMRIDSEGYFVFNGERTFLQSAHTGTWMSLSKKSDMVGDDIDRQFKQLDYMKAAGFNTVRFLAGPALPEMMDYCDKIGLIVYQEEPMAWKQDKEDSEALMHMAIRQMIERDRNHACFVMMGLLNETYQVEIRDGDYKSLVDAARDSLPVVRQYDNDLLVMNQSGRWDYEAEFASASNPGSLTWDGYMDDEGVVVTDDGKYGDNENYIGDRHFYPRLPFGAEDRETYMGLGGLRACFLSESGAGSQSNIINFRICQQETKGNFDMNANDTRMQVNTLYSLYSSRKLARVASTPEALILETERQQSEARSILMDYIRSNPKISGYSLTQGTDAGFRGEGILEASVDFKKGMYDCLVDGWRTTRWSLNVDKYYIYDDAGLSINCYLSDHGALENKEYTATFTLTGDEGCIWSKDVPVTPQFDAAGNPVYAIEVLTDVIPTDGLKAGEYRIGVTLGNTGVAASKTFMVANKSDLPMLSGRLYAKGLTDAAKALLESHGITILELDTENIVPGSTIIVGGKNMKNRDLQAIYDSVKKDGTKLIGLNPAAFGDWGYSNLPTSNTAAVSENVHWLYHFDSILYGGNIIAEGLPANTVMDPVYWEDVYPVTSFVNYGAGLGERFVECYFIGVNGGASSQALWYNPQLFTLNWGEGFLLLNTLTIQDSVGTPLADRLLLNMVKYTLAN